MKHPEIKKFNIEDCEFAIANAEEDLKLVRKWVDEGRGYWEYKDRSIEYSMHPHHEYIRELNNRIKELKQHSHVSD